MARETRSRTPIAEQDHPTLSISVHQGRHVNCVVRPVKGIVSVSTRSFIITGHIGSVVESIVKLRRAGFHVYMGQKGSNSREISGTRRRILRPSHALVLFDYALRGIACGDWRNEQLGVAHIVVSNPVCGATDSAELVDDQSFTRKTAAFLS